MAKTTVTVRMDEDFKAEAEAEFTLLDVSHTDVIHGAYAYIIRHHRLPYTTDGETLDAMKARLERVAGAAAEIVTKMGTKPELSTTEREAYVGLLDRAAMELDANWFVLKRAKGGFLPERWHEVLTATKGLSYLLSMTWDRQGARLHEVRTYRAPAEIIRACEVLTTNTASILTND